ncbi:MAG: hypothetical protein FWB72_07375 [Firmicutes bacterium]|nr:hypothetical protein [Bacillota bacterium]
MTTINTEKAIATKWLMAEIAKGEESIKNGQFTSYTVEELKAGKFTNEILKKIERGINAPDDEFVEIDEL